MPSQQSIEVTTMLGQYIRKLREKQPYKAPREGLIKSIKFQQDKNIKVRFSPLCCRQISLGVKTAKKLLYKQYLKIKNGDKVEMRQKSLNPQLIIIFYEQQKHEIFIQLFSLLKILNFPYFILNNTQQLNRLLGVRTLGALCINQQDFANSILKYLGKSLADVPWVLQISSVLDGTYDNINTIQTKE